MKILVIGGGGREHALCWKLAQSAAVEVHCAPGNPGIASVANTYATTDYVALAQRIRPGLTIVGPEAPLVQGIVDQFRSHDLPILGPTAAAAQIESSKAFAKELMRQAQIPTARYIAVQSLAEAQTALRSFDLPVVLKADGLAAGKGVIIAHTQEEAQSVVVPLLRLSGRLVIEEFLQGEEVSYIALTDGEQILPLEPAQDHKALLDSDLGPNTGGMGAYCDGRILDAGQRELILNTILQPAIAHMRANGTPFCGFLFAGLMLTQEGPKVLEFNARLGDPETQALLPLLASDLTPFLEAAARGQLDTTPLEWRPGGSACVVMAARGYPGDPITGDPITGLNTNPALVFQAGTRQSENVLYTSGGRVLGVTAAAETLPAAIQSAYAGVSRINFAGMQYRTDIGKKGLKRW